LPFSGAAPIHRGIARRHSLARLRRATAHTSAHRARRFEGARRHRRPSWFDLPDVPTMVELGFKDFVSDTFLGFLAPAKTPPAIVELLSAKSIEVLKKPNIAEQLRNNGFEVLGPGGMRKRIEDEVSKWRDVVAKAGIKPV
jgi:tripartite-type tricarboxylate transporter receptor subunit TctC